MKTVLNKSLDHVNMIACLLSDVYNSLGMVVPPRYTRLTLKKITNRVQREGYGFFTKSLPRLGKAFDKALLGQTALDCTGFRKEAGTQVPILFGNLFKRVFDLNGEVLPNPCVKSIRSLRQLLLVYYKYEEPNDPKLDQKVITNFIQTEKDVVEDVRYLKEKFGTFGGNAIPPHPGPLGYHSQSYPGYKEEVALLRRARRLVHNLFDGFDVSGIVPRHGPGVVSTKETGARKYVFERINPRAQMVFPFDKYFYVNMDHLCDESQSLAAVSIKESSAQVVLVPKDSRGPRVISCEPLENQWLQQGLMRAMVPWIERHPLTRNDVRFSDQEPNRMAALAGSYHGELCTLDLKEASDRVSVWLVEQLFPGPLLEALLATRSLATKLPDGTVLPLQKFAPMGSACCFPVLATCVWALLRAGSAGADGKTVLVYGDDVIVETAEAEHAIEQLETFGLHVNRDKSCTSGLFRESCGMDAYLGVDVTPVRFRTVWSSTPAADTYESWIAYANSLYHAGYSTTAVYIAESMRGIYARIPIEVQKTDVTQKGQIIKITPFKPHRYPALAFDSIEMLPMRSRVNRDFQVMEQLVRVVVPRKTEACQSGWVSLMRFFTERCESRDTSTVDMLKVVLEHLTQMSNRSLNDLHDWVCDDVPTDKEVSDFSDASLLGGYSTALLARASSLTGIPMPVVHECIRDAMRLAARDRRGGDPEPLLDCLNVYVSPHTSKLKWAWR